MKTLETLGMILAGRKFGKASQDRYKGAFRLLARYSEELPKDGNDLLKSLESLGGYTGETLRVYWLCIKNGYTFLADNYGVRDCCRDVDIHVDRHVQKLRYGNGELVPAREINEDLRLRLEKARSAKGVKRVELSEYASLVVRPALGYGLKRSRNEDGCLKADKMLGKVSSCLDCPFADCVWEACDERPSFSCRPLLKDKDIFLIKDAFDKVVSLGIDKGKREEYYSFLRRILRRQLKGSAYEVDVRCGLRMHGYRKFRASARRKKDGRGVTLSTPVEMRA